MWSHIDARLGHHAPRFKNIKALELLIEAGADVNILSTEQFGLPARSTPLQFAAQFNKTVFVATLLAAGADPIIVNSAGQTPLHSTVRHPPVNVVKALLAGGCDPLHQNNSGRTPLKLLFD